MVFAFFAPSVHQTTARSASTCLACLSASAASGCRATRAARAGAAGWQRRPSIDAYSSHRDFSIHHPTSQSERGQADTTGTGSGHAATSTGPQSSAAAHLLAQARMEEEESSAFYDTPAGKLSQRILEAQRKDIPWQGEESIEDAVLRMLVDKHKPLRVPGHKRQIQQPSSDPLVFPSSASASAATPPQPSVRVILPDGTVDQSHPGYRWQEGDPPRFPWEHTFKSPTTKDGLPSIRSGMMVPNPASALNNSSHNKSQRASPGDVAARVFRAKDASFDYATGSRDTAKAKIAVGQKGKTASAKDKLKAMGGSPNFSPVPASIRAWNTMVEERIELARQQGLFKNIKGRGKPIERDPDESNPFLGRGEFLMNRIVKRQEAAPPFVELQREMRGELDGFRARLRQAWIRRATRILSLQPITPSVIAAAGDFRDKEWEERERGYHERSVVNLNSLIRKYNMVAPSPVRMGVTSVETELAGCYRDCSSLIKEELQRRVKAGLVPTRLDVKYAREGMDIKGKTAKEEAAVKETMLSAFRRLVREVFAKEKQGSL